MNLKNILKDYCYTLLKLYIPLCKNGRFYRQQSSYDIWTFKTYLTIIILNIPPYPELFKSCVILTNSLYEQFLLIIIFDIYFGENDVKKIQIILHCLNFISLLKRVFKTKAESFICTLLLLLFRCSVTDKTTLLKIKRYHHPICSAGGYFHRFL